MMLKSIGSSIVNLIKNNYKSKNKCTVGLALGGGAVWGISHIGILKALEDNDIPIDFICGTSIGSLIGGLYAAGISTSQLLELALHTQWKHLASWTIPLEGLLSNEPMDKFIYKLIGNTSFSDLKIPFSVVSTDLISGQEVILTSGKLAPAIRSSTAIPGIFHPVRLGNKTLVDGGVVNNVPVSVAKAMGADLVIGVNLTPSFNAWIPKNSFEVIFKSFLIMQYKVVTLETSLSDIIINIDTQGFSPIDFRHSKDLYNKGLVAGLSSIDKINDCISKKR